jgi:hypothetical protein
MIPALLEQDDSTLRGAVMQADRLVGRLEHAERVRVASP